MPNGFVCGVLDTLGLVAKFVKSWGSRRIDDGDHTDCRVAAIALMYYVIRADVAIDQIERKLFDQTVQRYFDSEGADIKGLSTKAQQAYGEGTDVYQLAQVLQRQLTIMSVKLLFQTYGNSAMRTAK